MRHGDDDDISATHGTAYQDNFNLNGNAERQFLGAEEENAGRADVSRYERDRKFFLDVIDAAKFQWKFESGARINAMFGMNANRMSGHPSETSRLRIGKQRNDTKSRDRRRSRQKLLLRYSVCEIIRSG